MESDERTRGKVREMLRRLEEMNAFTKLCGFFTEYSSLSPGGSGFFPGCWKLTSPPLFAARRPSERFVSQRDEEIGGRLGVLEQGEGSHDRGGCESEGVQEGRTNKISRGD